MKPAPSVSPNRLATWVYRAASRPRASGEAGVVRRIMIRVRKIWLRLANPAVKFTWTAAGDLVLPLSHELGLIVPDEPGYGQNLGRLTRVLTESAPDFTAIDIGANVGDTALLLRHSGAAAVLAVEGAEEYLPYLRANCAGDPGIELAPEFVEVTGAAPMGRISRRGSSHLTPDSGGAAVGRPLSAILDQHPRFARPRLLKLDTDGLDLEILRASATWLAAVKPVLFFEYLPFFFRPHGTQPDEVFRLLTAIGYSSMLVYDNVGRFLCALALDGNAQLREDLLRYFERDHDGCYADVALFAREDDALARQLAAAERQVGRE